MLGREDLEGSPLTVSLMSILSDDKLEDLEEANPFSFKEFLKTKNLGLTKDDTTNSRIYPKEASRHSLGLDHSSPTPQTVGYGLEYQQPFFEDPTGAGDIVGEEEEDEDSGWNGAYLPSAVEKTHSSRQGEGGWRDRGRPAEVALSSGADSRVQEGARRPGVGAERASAWDRLASPAPRPGAGPKCLQARASAASWGLSVPPQGDSWPRGAAGAEWAVQCPPSSGESVRFCALKGERTRQLGRPVACDAGTCVLDLLSARPEQRGSERDEKWRSLCSTRCLSLLGRASRRTLPGQCVLQIWLASR
uniref:Endosome-associated-trafficking regulator 1 n=1 Tax=Urocitellus parryii TaxID=9999 RepID=A0A8D2KF01_UROPR